MWQGVCKSSAGNQSLQGGSPKSQSEATIPMRQVHQLVQKEHPIRHVQMLHATKSVKGSKSKDAGPHTKLRKKAATMREKSDWIA